MREPVEHIERATVPWRNEQKTECGKPCAEFTRVLTRDEAIAKFRELGRQRAAMTTCMTCMTTCNNHGSWATDPAGVMARIAESDRWHDSESLCARELRALEMLWSAHRDEFDATMESLTSATALSDRRSSRAYNHRTMKGRGL